MKLPLRVRLALTTALASGVLVTGLSIGSYRLLARTLDADMTQRLSDLTEGLHGYLRVDAERASLAFDEADDDQAAFVHEATRYYQVYDVKTGRLLAQSNAFKPLGYQLTPGEVQAWKGETAAFDLPTDYGRLRIANSVKGQAGQRRYLLQVGLPLSNMDNVLARYRQLLWIGLPVALIAVALVSWWLARFELRPLTRIAALVGPIDIQALERRLPVAGTGDELDRVARAFNGTLERLEQSIGEMRQFSAALAHELRTPLAGLRGEIELALRTPGLSETLAQSFGSQLEAIDRLTRLIDQILTLARAEAGQIRLAAAPVDVSALARSVVEQLEPIADVKGVSLQCAGEDAVTVVGDAGWLQRLLLNLIDNAIKFTAASGRVVVRVAREGDEARVEVADTGIGLSTADAAQVFERFFRADLARSTQGAGLGLSLVQWIARQHHGTVVVESRLGEGATFIARLPVQGAKPSRTSLA